MCVTSSLHSLHTRETSTTEEIPLSLSAWGVAWLPFCHSCSRFFMPVSLNLSKHICGEFFWSMEHLWHVLSSLPLLSRGYLFPSWSIERVRSCHCFNAKLVVYLWEASIFNVTAFSLPASPASLNVFTVLSDYIVSIFSVQLLLSFYVDLHENNKP